MAFYESTFIVRPDLNSQQAEQIGEKLAKAAEGKEAKIIKSEYWGLRTLAYRVKKHRKGHYVMVGYEANGAAAIDEVERQARLSDDVIRFLTVRVEELSKDPSPMMNQKARGSARRERSAADFDAE